VRVNQVLHIISGLGDGGAEGVLYRLVRSHQDADHAVVTLGGPGKYSDKLEALGVAVYHINMPKNVIGFVRGFLALRRLIKGHRYRVIQTWMPHADFLGGLASVFNGTPSVYWCIRHTYVSWRHSPLTNFIILINGLLSHFIPTKIVCCAYSAKEVHKRLGFCERKLVLIENGIDTDVFRPFLKIPSAVKNEFIFPDNYFLFGMVARMDAQKDHGNLLRACSLLKSRGYKFRIAIIGTGVLGGRLREAIERYDLQDLVILSESRDDIASIMNCLDAHVLSSINGEGFPNVVAEAMACGKPAIATDVGDSRRIIGNTGWIVAASSHTELAEAMADCIELKKNSSLWNAKSQQARVRIEKLFSLKEMVDNFDKLWF